MKKVDDFNSVMRSSRLDCPVSSLNVSFPSTGSLSNLMQLQILLEPALLPSERN